MANLWRTQRPRFPQYISDGNGRDYYIKFNNAGYWGDQFIIQKKPDYEYPKYNNYHSLFHQAAPVKYIPTGNGRETYIINAGGMYHDQKPLASYKLDDFLRGQNIAEKSPKFDSKKHYLSVSEKKYNNKLQTLEKQLINRLYKLPMRNKKIVNRNIILEDDKMLPSLDTKNGSMSNNHIHYASDSNIFNKGEKANTIDCITNYTDKFRRSFLNKINKQNKKINKNQFKRKKLDIILKQSQKIENYEMKNHSRRSNNQTDYNIYKNGRIGCRFNNAKTLVNSWSENFKNRIFMEGNQTFNKKRLLGNSNKKFKKNKFTFSPGSSSEENRVKPIEY
jgi:hypothetical protein